MIRWILITLIAFTSIAHADTTLSLMGSLNYNNPDPDESTYDGKSGGGAGVGLRALMGISDQLLFRSGGGLVYKKFTVESNGASKGDFDFSFTYLSIPLTLYWKASPQVGIFGGTSLNAKMNDSCDANGDFDTCEIDEEKAVVFPAIIGFDFNFTERLGMEISYEYGMTETAKDLKVHSAVVSLLYHFDNT